MDETVKLLVGQHILKLGYPLIIVSTQPKQEGKLPGEYLLSLRDGSTLQVKPVCCGRVTWIEPSEDIGVHMEKSDVGAEARMLAEGQLWSRSWRPQKRKTTCPFWAVANSSNRTGGNPLPCSGGWVTWGTVGSDGRPTAPGPNRSWSYAESS